MNEIAKADTSSSMADGELLFCPFCRECFEGEKECPDHGMDLVPFDQLPKRKTTLGIDSPIPLFMMGHGRWCLLAGFLVTFVGFLLPFLTVEIAEARTWTGFGVAIGRTPQLWAVPVVAMMFGSVFFRRRTLRKLKSGRLGVLVLAALGGYALFHTMSGISRGTEQLAQDIGQEVLVTFELGAYVCIAGLSIAAVGVVLLGRSGPADDVREDPDD